ncbi:MFS transporter [Pseudonocardia oroxyli]|uniref:Predicted arabinose efflux permease, MFS family n=1 Tax=Pseudonocardia oroxyli TaxID=366584 RepID=A0A1G7RP63_PSEOR|nr:MFS transporter [Pseudonocardia oroxyli]SDG12577.1 Predicted arabinose efflux permease, MFS family [Pseudonocardia oroxyli]
MFVSLRVPNYRLFLSGQIVSNVGTWMQRIAQDWLVLDLTGGSATALGIAAALQFTPMLFLTLWGGVLADRVDKRIVLVVVQAAMGLCAVALGTVVLTGVVQLWHVYLLCLLLGCFSAFDTPMRQSFVSEMVGPGQVVNAVALNSMVFNLARIIGPAVAGALIVAVGTGWVFLINAASFVGVISGLLLMRPERLYRSERVPRAPGQLRDGLAYVRARPDLVAIMVLVFLVSTFGINFFMTIALLARNVFGRDAQGYGLLTTLLAVGSVLGATFAARRTTKPRLRMVAGSGVVFGVLLVVAGSMPTYLTAGLALVPVGLAALLFTTSANSAVQLSVDPTVRGRVMGIYMLLLLGGTPLGAPVLGVVAEHFGGRSPLIVGGVVTVLSVLAVAVVLARRGEGGWRQQWRRGVDEQVRLG